MNNFIKRSRLIVIIGIVGFIDVAFSIISGVFKIFTGIEFLNIAEANINQSNGLDKVDGFEKAVNNLNNAFGGQLVFANKLVENSIILGVIVIVSALISFVGLMWMWNLRKKGFLYFVLGQLVPIASFLIFVGFSFSYLWLLPIIFILLWAYNLKYMS
ncbi:MAG: hypothetical protein HY951_01875 [Bacteroidia bacterium]|nr:hypothetical protein [Bacteroidia bacterium]